MSFTSIQIKFVRRTLIFAYDLLWVSVIPIYMVGLYVT